MQRVVRWLAGRYAPWVVIAIGIALCAPALTADFTVDDHLHRVMSRADTGIPGLASRPFDLFRFADGNPATAAQLRDDGMFAWWTDPHLKLAFFRPLTSATHALDHALWPDSAPAQLAHNLVWLAIGLGVVWLFFRRFLLARWIAVLALALYAFDDARGPVVGWIANRNALLALALAVPVLLVHDRWRREGWSAGRWLAPLLFAVSLGAGESSIAILAYVAAHALWLDKAPWRDRIIALAPYGILLVAWRVLYVHLGYGVAGSGIYLDPGADPVAFVTAAASRIAFLLQGQLALPWSDLSSFYAVIGIAGAMLAIAVAMLAAIALACARLLRRDETARFFATGMVLAAVPVATTFPADRLLSFIGLGGMGLVAQLLAAALRDRSMLGDGRARRLFATVVALGLVAVNLVLAPPLLVLRSRSMVAVARVVDRADAGIPHDPSITEKTVIITATPSDALAGYTPVMRVSRGQPRPAHIYWLATATTAVTIERVDARTLRVSADGGMLRYEVDQMMRSPRTRPFAVGDRVALTGLTIEVEAITADGRPQAILARFDHPLDDPSLVWLRWQGHTYVPYTPPAIGVRDTQPPVDFLKLLDDK
jgi:hypothetical protein